MIICALNKNSLGLTTSTHSRQVYDSGCVQVSVVKFNKGFSNCIVIVRIHRNLLLDNKELSRVCDSVFTPNQLQNTFVLYEIAKYHFNYEHLD